MAGDGFQVTAPALLWRQAAPVWPASPPAEVLLERRGICQP